MKIFGSTVLNKGTSKDKFEARSNKGIFIGYPRESKGYRVWLPDSRKIVVARDVKFLEKTPEASEDSNEFDFLQEPNQERIMVSDDDETATKDVEFTFANPVTPMTVGVGQQPEEMHPEDEADRKFFAPGAVVDRESYTSLLTVPGQTNRKPLLRYSTMSSRMTYSLHRLKFPSLRPWIRRRRTNGIMLSNLKSKASSKMIRSRSLRERKDKTSSVAG